MCIENMKKLLIALLLMFSFSAWAGDFEQGKAAYEKGDYVTAMAKFKLAAAQGDTNAESYIGLLYKDGAGVKQNLAEAARRFGIAAKQGQAWAQNSLALLYLIGAGVAQDYSAAVTWWKIAAMKGFNDAQYNLGTMYANGTGVQQDNVLAHMWFNLAAGDGSKDAVKGRDLIAKEMTSKQIELAQKMARDCQVSSYKSCDYY